MTFLLLRLNRIIPTITYPYQCKKQVFFTRGTTNIFVKKKQCTCRLMKTPTCSSWQWVLVQLTSLRRRSVLVWLQHTWSNNPNASRWSNMRSISSRFLKLSRLPISLFSASSSLPLNQFGFGLCPDMFTSGILCALLLLAPLLLSYCVQVQSKLHFLHPVQFISLDLMKWDSPNIKKDKSSKPLCFFFN